MTATDDRHHRHLESLTISAEPDDAAGYRKRSGGGGGSTGSSGGGGRSFVSNIFMVLIIAALAVAGWFIANQHEQLSASDAALENANQRLLLLEDRLKATDEVFSEVGQETTKEIDYWESEVRKLWDVTNKRNKAWIEENQRGLKSVTASIATIKSDVAELGPGLERALDAASKQQAILDQLTALEKQIRQIADNSAAAKQGVNSLTSRVTESEQGLAAFDAFRLQLNRRLSDLERRLDELAASPGL
ncbi:MAG: hypothetical protein NXH85_06110 [Pseudomonadaceae bacterium]|nr:hypothetical protein [Pseudomonadaceae bacterium]